MKRNLLLVMIFMAMSVAAMAQSDRAVIRLRPTPPPFTPEHEFRLGISPISVLSFSHNDSPPGNYRGNRSVNTGAISLVYTYKISRLLEIGGTFIYTGDYAGRYQFQRKVGACNQTLLAINPTVRFSWFNRRSIRLYSSLSIGAGVLLYKNNTDIVKDESVSVMFSGQFTPFGFSAGRKVFFFMEPFCVGTQGTLFIAGIGFRFPAKQQETSLKY